MKVVILAGGLGTRISEYTKTMPKPMISVCGKPIIHRIINHYIKFGHKEFVIALGYKGNLIKKYFLKTKFKEKVKIDLINTGLKTMTGGRLKKLKKHLNETFMMTYGDGLSNVNISNLIKFHKSKKKLFTLTAVRPPARFGTIKIHNSMVKVFREKNSLDEGWINGGFFVMEPEIFKFIKNDQTILERYPLEKICKTKKLGAYKHYGLWQCMDTIRDKKILENLVKNSFLK